VYGRDDSGCQWKSGSFLEPMDDFVHHIQIFVPDNMSVTDLRVHIVVDEIGNQPTLNIKVLAKEGIHFFRELEVATHRTGSR